MEEALQFAKYVVLVLFKNVFQNDMDERLVPSKLKWHADFTQMTLKDSERIENLLDLKEMTVEPT